MGRGCVDGGGRAFPEAAALVAALTARGLTVAVAESLTGGGVTAAVVDVPGASRVLRGGVVAYATELKAALLGVDADLLARTGPVHPDVAAQMARGVRSRLDADLGLATTGVAGPGRPGGAPAGRGPHRRRLGARAPGWSRCGSGATGRRSGGTAARAVLACALGGRGGPAG